MLFDQYRYVVVEGPIGVGKTSLACRLAKHYGATAFLEKPEENYFLARFYENPARYALSTQLFFLLQRIDEVRDLVQMDWFHASTVADYLFDKDALFARLNLGDDEFALYQKIYHSLAPQAPAPAPDLVIYLQASPEFLVERVHRRALPYERKIAESYLTRLVEAYSHFFGYYDAAPVFVVNSEYLNFVESDEDFTFLLQRIGAMRGQRELFNKGA